MLRGDWREKSSKALQVVKDTFNISQHLNKGSKYCFGTDTSGTNPCAAQFLHGEYQITIEQSI